jgi:hypothetical protein
LLWTFVYLMVGNLFALVWLLARRHRSKEFEILQAGSTVGEIRRRDRLGGLIHEYYRAAS